MKAQLMRISAGIIALAALGYILACSSPSGNVNQNRSIAAMANGWEFKPCTKPVNPAAKAAELRDKLKDQINGNDALKNELNPDPTAARDRFTVDVQLAPDTWYFEAYIKGSVGGDDNLKTLSDIVNNYQEDPDDCLRVVHFVNLGATNAPSGFKWSSCQYPKYVCANGACCDEKSTPIPGSTPAPTPDPLASPGGNANTSRKGNTNN